MNSNISSYSYGVTLLLVIGVIVLVSTGVVMYRSKKSIKSRKHQEKKGDDYTKAFEEKIKAIEKNFTNKAIGYYLQEKIFTMNLSKQEKEALFDKLGYQEEFSSPYIEWSKEFAFMKDAIDQRDKMLHHYLIEKNGRDICQNGEFILNCFERYLLEKAKQKAETILSNVNRSN